MLGPVKRQNEWRKYKSCWLVALLFTKGSREYEEEFQHEGFGITSCQRGHHNICFFDWTINLGNKAVKNPITSDYTNILCTVSKSIHNLKQKQNDQLLFVP